MYTKEEIKNQLKGLGIKSTDTVLIHTSFKAVGEVEGGPDAFIDAFCEYLSDGLFIIPTHTWGVINKENPVFDYKETVPNIGLIPRTAAKRSDGIRSLHPTHSIWAHGKGAEEFIKGEEKAMTPAPVGGAWWRLNENKAKIFLIGVNHGRDTFIHAVDEMADLDDRLSPNSWEVSVILRNGEKITHSYRSHGKTGSDNFNIFEPMFKALGVQTEGQIGNAFTRVVDAAKCRDVLLKIYEKTTYNYCLNCDSFPEEVWKDLKKPL